MSENDFPYLSLSIEYRELWRSRGYTGRVPDRLALFVDGVEQASISISDLKSALGIEDDET